MHGQSDLYRPQHEPLMMRNFIQHSNPDNGYSFTSPYRSPSRCSSIADSHSSYQQSIYSGSYNSPHPRRVRTMKGLLDLPICVVDDNDDYPNYLQRPESRYSRQTNMNTQQAPLDTLNGLAYTSVRNIPQGTKITPILKRRQEPWQEELKALTQAVFFDTMKICDEELMKTEEYKVAHHPFPVCRPVTPTKDQIRRSIQSQVNISNPKPYSHSSRDSLDPDWKEKRIQHGLNEIRTKNALDDNLYGAVLPLQQNSHRRPIATQLTYEDNCQDKVFQMLCRLLNTDDSVMAAKWLASASDREKSLILKIMRSMIPETHNPSNNETTKNEEVAVKDHTENRPQTALATINETKVDQQTVDDSKKEVSIQASFNNKINKENVQTTSSRPVSRPSSVIYTVPSSFPNLRSSSYMWRFKEKRHPRASVLSDDILSNSRPKTTSAVTLRYTTNDNKQKLFCG